MTNIHPTMQRALRPFLNVPKPSKADRIIDEFRQFAGEMAATAIMDEPEGSICMNCKELFEPKIEFSPLTTPEPPIFCQKCSDAMWEKFRDGIEEKTGTQPDPQQVMAKIKEELDKI